MPEDLHLWWKGSVQNAIYSKLPLDRVLSVSNRHLACPSNYVYSPNWFDFNDAFFSRCGSFSSLQTLRLHYISSRDLSKLAATVGWFIRRLEIGFNGLAVMNSRQVLRFASLHRLSIICNSSDKPSGSQIPCLSWDLPQLQILDTGNISNWFLDSLAQSM